MEQILKQIRVNWLLLVFLVTVVMTWTTFDSRLTDVEAKDVTQNSAIRSLEVSSDVQDSRLQNLEANVYLLCKAQSLNCIPPINK